MASGWLQKAQSVFGRREEPPQPYVVTCECGMAYSGIRSEKPQKTACSRCGADLFIFPVCPYPIPDSIAKRMRGEDREPTKSQSAERPKEGRHKPDKKPSGKPPNKAVRVPEDEPTPAVPLSDRAGAMLQQFRSLFTPLRIVMIGLAVTVGATIAIAVRNARIESARREVEPAIERGLKAYAEHDFATASAELTVAVRALDRLDRTDATAQQVRQRGREADAAAGLLSASIGDTLAEILNEKSTESLATRVDRRLSGQWLFFDAPVVATADSESRSDSPRLEVETAMMIGKIVCRVEFSRHPGPAWPKPQAEALPQRAIFAAQLETIRVGDGGRQADAVIVLNGSTAVLWTSAEGYAGMIPPPTDDNERQRWQAVLDAQQAALFPPKAAN